MTTECGTVVLGVVSTAIWVWSKLPARDPLFPFAHALGVRYWLDVPGGGDRDSFAAGFAAAA